MNEPKPDGYHALAFIEYNPDITDENHTGVRVRFTALANGVMSALTEIELQVFAAEVGLIVRKCFETRRRP